MAIEAKDEAVSEQLRLKEADRAGTLGVPAPLFFANDSYHNTSWIIGTRRAHEYPPNVQSLFDKT